jgi:hypothetical protein
VGSDRRQQRGSARLLNAPLTQTKKSKILGVVVFFVAEEFSFLLSSKIYSLSMKVYFSFIYMHHSQNFMES